MAELRAENGGSTMRVANARLEEANWELSRECQAVTISIFPWRASPSFSLCNFWFLLPSCSSHPVGRTPKGFLRGLGHDEGFLGGEGNNGGRSTQNLACL